MHAVPSDSSSMRAPIDCYVARVQAASHADLEGLAFPLFDAQEPVALRFAEQPTIQSFAVAGFVFEVADFAARFPAPWLAFESVGRRWILARVDIGEGVFGGADVGQRQRA